MVFEQLRTEGLLADGNRLVFHAGRDYHEELTPLLSETSVEFTVPTDGLQFGETLSWYNDRI